MRQTMMSGALMTLVMIFGSSHPSAADEAPEALIRKGIAALGGEAKLNAALKGMKYKVEGKLSIQGNDSDVSIQTTLAGLGKIRSEVRGEFNGNAFEVVTVVDGARGWRKINDATTDLEPDQIADTKRNLYLVAVPATLVALVDKEQGFKVAADGEEKVGGKEAKVVKVTGPDGKTFRLFLDGESGLPLKMTATVNGQDGIEHDQVTTFADYKEVGGIKKSTTMEMTLDGNRYITGKISDFQIVDHPAATFAEPK